MLNPALASGRSTLVVTGCDAFFFPLLDDLLRSLEAGPFSSTLPVGIFDVGLTPEQRADLTGRGYTLVEPGWDIEDFPDRPRVPGHYRALMARPYIPRYFPGYDQYMWIDADAWVQDDSVLPWFLAAAARGQLAMVPELDRSYWTMFKPPKFWGQNQKAFAWGYGLKAGYRLGRNPILNAGVFALAADAPHWQRYGDHHREALLRRRWFAKPGSESYRMNLFISEQTALNRVVFGDKLPHTLLPAVCNWFCGKGTPQWDAERGLLVEPNAPHASLGIIHLAGKGMKDRVWTLDSLQGGQVTCKLTWSEVSALKQKALVAV